MPAPDIYVSDSSDSKYSNQDDNFKDHLLHGEAALQHYLRKNKHADFICQSNKLKGKVSCTSHLIAYLD